MAPPISSNFSEPVNVTLFSKRDFAGMMKVKDREMGRSFWIIRKDLV